MFMFENYSTVRLRTTLACLHISSDAFPDCPVRSLISPISFSWASLYLALPLRPAGLPGK